MTVEFEPMTPAASAAAAAVAPQVVRQDLKSQAKQIRKIIIDQSKRAGVGHIGSALSVADIVACLYGRVLNIPWPRHPDRDRFVMAKGHAALALYAAFFQRGWISEEQLNGFCGPHTLLGVHPEYLLPGVDFSTGSLGQGLTFAVGAALAAKKLGSSRRVFALVSDAELNEGSVWEAAMFAAHHKLDNLFVFIDNNGQQAFGYTKDVLDLSPLVDKWSVFGWDAVAIDGHDQAKMLDTISGAMARANKPHVIIADTTFGEGVSFMRNQIKWHYSPLSDADYERACRELEAAP